MFRLKTLLILAILFVVGMAGLYRGRHWVNRRWGIYLHWQHYFGRQLPSPHFVTLRWKAIPEMPLYNVYRSEKSGGPYTKIVTTPLAFYVDVPVPPAAELYYTVTAVNQVGESAPTAEVKITVPIRWKAED